MRKEERDLRDNRTMREKNIENTITISFWWVLTVHSFKPKSLINLNKILITNRNFWIVHILRTTFFIWLIQRNFLTRNISKYAVIHSIQRNISCLLDIFILSVYISSSNECYSP